MATDSGQKRQCNSSRSASTWTTMLTWIAAPMGRRVGGVGIVAGIGVKEILAPRQSVDPETDPISAAILANRAHRRSRRRFPGAADLPAGAVPRQIDRPGQIPGSAPEERWARDWQYTAIRDALRPVR